MQLVSKIVPILMLLALTFNAQAQSFFTHRNSAQVLYPSVPDYHYYPTVPMESAPLVTFDSPQTPVRPPTIPPNAAHGLEHESAFVIPGTRVITQHKLGVVSPLITTTVIPEEGLARSATHIMTTTITPGVGIVHAFIPEPPPRGVPSRFMTTPPTISYSDELPVTVTITISP